MKHAIIILSSYGYEYLENCIKQFENDNDIDLYIHIDSETYNTIDNFNQNNYNIKYIGHLYDCPRFSTNLAKIMFDMLKIANNNYNYDYYHFFSDHCYLAKPLQYFKQFFVNNDKTYLMYWNNDECARYVNSDKKIYLGSQWSSLYKTVVNEILKYESNVNNYINDFCNSEIVIEHGAFDEMLLTQLIIYDLCNEDEELINKYNIINCNLRYHKFYENDSHPMVVKEENIFDVLKNNDNILIIRKINFKNPSSCDVPNKLSKHTLTIWCAYHDPSFIDSYKLKNTNIIQLYQTSQIRNDCVNINHLHYIFGEYTAMYYVWKNNIKSKYVGFSHYRRQFNVNDIDYNKLDQGYVYYKFKDSLMTTPILHTLDFMGFNYYLIDIIKYQQKYFNINIDDARNNLYKVNPVLKTMYICKWEIFCEIMEYIDGFLKYVFGDYTNEKNMNMYIDNMYDIYSNTIMRYKTVYDIGITYYDYSNNVHCIQQRSPAILIEYLVGNFLAIKYNDKLIYNRYLANVINVSNLNNFDSIIDLCQKNKDKYYYITNYDKLKLNLKELKYKYPNLIFKDELNYSDEENLEQILI